MASQYIIENLCIKYNIKSIDKQTLFSLLHKKQNKKKTILSKEERCNARKQDGLQCSRRKKGTHDFCGKHIKNRPYGTFNIQIDKNNIPVNKYSHNNKDYYIDSNNILYNSDCTCIIGKLLKNNEIYYVSQLQNKKLNNFSH